MKKEPLYFLLIIYTFLFFLIHYLFGYFDFIFILIFLFFFIEFKWKNKWGFILVWTILLIYYFIKYFILFENWMATIFILAPCFLFLKKEYFKKIQHFLIPTIIIGIFAFIFLVFYKAGLFYEEPLVMNDYPYHFYRAWLVTDILIPKYNSIIGWVPYFQGGYIELYDYPPGIFLLTYLIKKISFLSTILSFRINIFISFILSTFSVFIFSYKFTKSLWAGILSMMLWVAWTHYYFLEGLFTAYYSLSFLLLSLMFYKFWYEKKKVKFFLASSLFGGLSLLFHAQIFLHLVVVMFVFHLVYAIKKWHYFITFVLISLCIGAIYLVEVYFGLSYSKGSWVQQVKFFPDIFNAVNTYLNDFLYQYTLPLFMSIFGAMTLHIYNEKSNLVKFLILNIVLFMISMFGIQIMQTYYPVFPIVVLRPQRSSIIMKVFILVLASYSLTFILKKLNLNKPSNSLLSGLIVSIVIIFIVSNLIYFYNVFTSSDYSQFKKVYWGKTFQEVYQLNFNSGVFRFEPKRGVVELMEWLKDLDTNKRILIEDSTSRSLGGHVVGLFPIYTNKTFIGGPFPTIKTSEPERNAYEGYFFGEPITNYTHEEFNMRLDEFNIEYIIVWSKESIKFLSEDKALNKLFVTSDGLFHAFKY